MCYEIAGNCWEGNYKFYNNLMPRLLNPQRPISYVDMVCGEN